MEYIKALNLGRCVSWVAEGKEREFEEVESLARPTRRQGRRSGVSGGTALACQRWSQARRPEVTPSSVSVMC